MFDRYYQVLLYNQQCLMNTLHDNNITSERCKYTHKFSTALMNYSFNILDIT